MDKSAVLGVSDNVELAAKSAICIRMADGVAGLFTTLYEKDVDRPISPASITKLLTAATVLRISCTMGIPITTQLSVLPSDIVEGSGKNLREGDRLSVRHGLVNLLLASSNVSANVIARSFGSILLREEQEGTASGDAMERFVAEMNSVAGDLRMSASRFLNAHGLAIRGQRSTARDLSRLVRECLQHPLICGLWGLEKYGIQIDGPDARRLVVRSIFRESSRKAIPDFALPQFKGGKSGTLWPSVFNLAAVSETANGDLIISVTMGSPSLIDRHRDYLSMVKIGNEVV